MDEVLGRSYSELLPAMSAEVEAGGLGSHGDGSRRVASSTAGPVRAVVGPQAEEAAPRISILDPRPSLVVEGLTRRFSGAERPAVEGVSFGVRPGELLALVGASGSGKTTTLRMIAGYERPDAGRILLRNADRVAPAREITNIPAQERGFGMVFQHYALFPHMSVVDNVAFGLEARRVGKLERLERAHAALTRVGLEGAGGRAVQSLSGGEQQRVALARALVIEPSVLLLDEPLSNLDPTLRQTTRDQLRAMLLQLRVTAVFVTHDQEDAFAMADRVAMLHRGHLLQVGTPEELYHHPNSFEVAQFIGHSTLVEAHRVGQTASITLAGVEQRAPVGTVVGNRPPEEPMVAVIRPEAVAIASCSGDIGAWCGRVVSRRFAGTHFIYHVEVETVLGAGSHVTFEIASDHGDAGEGAAVAVVLLPKPLALLAPRSARPTPASPTG